MPDTGDLALSSGCCKQTNTYQAVEHHEAWVHRDGCAKVQTQLVMESRRADESRGRDTSKNNALRMPLSKSGRQDQEQCHRGRRGTRNMMSERLGKRFKEGGEVNGPMLLESLQYGRILSLSPIPTASIILPI